MSVNNTIVKEHPQAAILRAIADGKPVQYKDKDVWIDWTTKTLSDHQWRIKPEKKTGWLNIFASGAIQMMFATREQADKHNQQLQHVWGNPGRVACIQIEYTEGEGLVV